MEMLWELHLPVTSGPTVGEGGAIFVGASQLSKKLFRLFGFRCCGSGT